MDEHELPPLGNTSDLQNVDPIIVQCSFKKVTGLHVEDPLATTTAAATDVIDTKAEDMKIDTTGAAAGVGTTEMATATNALAMMTAMLQAVTATAAAEMITTMTLAVKAKVATDHAVVQ